MKVDLVRGVGRPKSAYTEKLLDPRWQRVRLNRLDAAKWACETCGETNKTLHVHHRVYVRGRDPWAYAASELGVLCHDCHHSLHEAKKKARVDQALAREARKKEMANRLLARERAMRASARGAEVMDTKACAKFLCCSTQWLEIARLKGGGPPYAKIGRMVRYQRSTVLQWIAEREVKSTSEKQSR